MTRIFSVKTPLFAVLSLIRAVVVTGTIVTSYSLEALAGELTTPYTDPANLEELPFGYQSHWIQPWRAYLQTVPAANFLDGIGMVFNVGGRSVNPELIAQMLANHGVRRVRFEIGWGKVDYDDESRLTNASKLREQLLALKKYGIRPLILLNAHQGAPCPWKFLERTVVEDAAAGETTIQLDNVADLKVGYSGLSELTDHWAAEALITNISGNTVTLSKPLPKAIKAGTVVPMATLKYRPFSAPDSEDYKATIAGWQRYVGTVSKFVAETLGTTDSSDKGFDLEIWNELTFGSEFLSINNYYDPDLVEYNEDSIQDNLVAETVAHVEANDQAFEKVQITNGFANTQPWPAASEQPERIHAISKHPYATQWREYPQDEAGGQPINALYEAEDKSSFVPPTYSVLFPEYFATALQTETIIRDMGPITNSIHGVDHGRNSRVINGEVVPVPVWLTEVNTNPKLANPQVSAELALAIKAKTTARYYSFFLNKGAAQVHLFAAVGNDRGWGIVQENFLELAAQSDAVYPDDDTAYTSPALATLGRMVAQMRQDVDMSLTETRQLTVASIRDSHDHYQFAGDGTEAHPNLYDRDVFAFLPFQVNKNRFVIPYYVMTRNVMQDLGPAEFTLDIRGLNGSGATVTAYDPIADEAVPVEVQQRGADQLVVELTAEDYPYLLIVQEAD